MSQNGTNGVLDPSKMDPALLATFPALSPPYGVESNFNNPPSIAYQCRVAIYVLLPIMLCHVLLRMYRRLRGKNSLGTDDYGCVLSALILVVYCAITLQIMGNPLGPHLWNVRLVAVTETFVKISRVEFVLYTFLATSVKLSILFLYRRLFWVRVSARYMIWIGMVTITLFYMACFVASTVHCMPRNGEGWLSQSTKERCSRIDLRLSVAQGFFGVISDFYLLAIPLLQVSKLRVTTSQKVGLAGVFLTGLLACICSVTLCVYRFRQQGTEDYTYMSVPVYTFSVAELNMGIICSCMPVIFVVVKSFLKKITSTIKGRSSGNKPDPIPTGDALPIPGPSRPKPVKLLPGVPKGHLSTLMSFIRNGRRNNTENASLENEELLMTDMSDFDPHRDGYHAHI